MFSLIKDIYLMSSVLLILQVSKNMTLINMYFASNGKVWRVRIAITAIMQTSNIAADSQLNVWMKL